MTGRTWTVTIPAPAEWLNANGRTDRRRQTPARRAWRDAGRLHSRSAKVPHLAKAHIVAELRFAGPNRRRDPHNYYPTIKATVDGLIDSGLLPDDSSEYLIGPDVRMGQPLPKTPYGPVGELILTITELTDADPC
jgi:hypothetical protein